MTKHTLNTKRDILALLQSPNKHSSPYINFFWKQSNCPRSAITCAKRCLKRAVDRNYFKRINRSYICQAAKQGSCDMLVVARPKFATLSRKNMKQVIIRAWTSFQEQYNIAC